MRTPPTMHDLLTDERYARYIAKPPKLPESLNWGKPYMILGLKTEGGWARALRSSYEPAYELFLKLLEDERYSDVTIVSRRRIVKEPYWHKVPGYEWCGRCRRPTVYAVNDSHPALRDAPVIMDGVERCYFCGISRDLGNAPRAVKLKKEKKS